MNLAQNPQAMGDTGVQATIKTAGCGGVVAVNGGTFQVLEDFINSNVLVRLKGGRTLKGILEAYDNHLNVLLKQAEEIEGERVRQLGTVLVRGDNVIVISPAK